MSDKQKIHRAELKNSEVVSVTMACTQSKRPAVVISVRTNATENYQHENFLLNAENALRLKRDLDRLFESDFAKEWLAKRQPNVLEEHY